MLSWKKEFETNIDQVDKQHKRLFEILGEFYELSKDGEASRDSLDQAVQSLKEYAEKHFEDEEKIMEENNIDDRHCKMHRMEHRSFTYDVVKMSSHLDPEESPIEMSNRLVHFGTSWLAYHILGIDQVMARQLSAISGGMEPSKAYEQHGEVIHDQHTMKVLLDTVFKLWRDATDRCIKLEERLQ